MFSKINDDKLINVFILVKRIWVIDLFLHFITFYFYRKKYFKIAEYIFLNNIIIFIYYNIIILYHNIITIKNYYFGTGISYDGLKSI